MIVTFFRTTAKLLRETFRELAANDFLRMAGATAFFASFALPPILMIIVRTLGLFLDRRQLGRQLGQQLRTILGPEGTESILQTIRSFRSLQQNYLATALIFLFLLFVATTLFRVIKNSINEIWNIRKKQAGRMAAGLRSRALSVAVILVAGILFVTVQLAVSGQQMLGRYLVSEAPAFLLAGGRMLSFAIVVLLSTVWFYVLFLWLPDGKPDRKVALFGALITSLLFNGGKWVLQGLLNPVKVHQFYGASGALVLLLLFIFYSAIMLYFGAAFTKAWGAHCGKPIRMKGHAVQYHVEEDEHH